MTIKTRFEIGQIVYLKTDPEQNERIITGIMVRPTMLIYYIAFGMNETTHYDIEITTEKDVLKAITSYKEQ